MGLFNYRYINNKQISKVLQLVNKNPYVALSMK